MKKVVGSASIILLLPQCQLISYTLNRIIHLITSLMCVCVCYLRDVCGGGGAERFGGDGLSCHQHAWLPVSVTIQLSITQNKQTLSAQLRESAIMPTALVNVGEAMSE